MRQRLVQFLQIVLFTCTIVLAHDNNLITYEMVYLFLHTSQRAPKGGGRIQLTHIPQRAQTWTTIHPEVDCPTGVAIPFVGVCTSDECSVVGSRGDPITGSPITYRSTSLSVMIPTSLPCVGPVPPSTTTSRCTRRCRRSSKSWPSESYCVQVITPGKSRERWESADWIV